MKSVLKITIWKIALYFHIVLVIIVSSFEILKFSWCFGASKMYNLFKRVLLKGFKSERCFNLTHINIPNYTC